MNFPVVEWWGGGVLIDAFLILIIYSCICSFFFILYLFIFLLFIYQLINLFYHLFIYYISIVYIHVPYIYFDSNKEDHTKKVNRSKKQKNQIKTTHTQALYMLHRIWGRLSVMRTLAFSHPEVTQDRTSSFFFDKTASCMGFWRLLRQNQTKHLIE